MQLQKFKNSHELAEHFAEEISLLLQSAISQKRSASIAVSGGSTPLKLFKALSKKLIEWNKVSVTLVDERWVDIDNERSNARLVQDNFLKSKAANATFIPLYQDEIDHTEIASTRDRFDQYLPFDVVVLGMGLDGHTASFFPGGDNLEIAIDINNEQILIDMQALDAGEPRVTFTLPPLISAKNLYLHIEGEKKLQLLEEANENLRNHAYPIQHVLKSADHLKIVWAP